MFPVIPALCHGCMLWEMMGEVSASTNCELKVSGRNFIPDHQSVLMCSSCKFWYLVNTALCLQVSCSPFLPRFPSLHHVLIQFFLHLTGLLSTLYTLAQNSFSCLTRRSLLYTQLPPFVSKAKVQVPTRYFRYAVPHLRHLRRCAYHKPASSRPSSRVTILSPSPRP
jgi:hypothetical protein